MSMEVTVDVVFHIDRFRTYDMLSQGTHRLKIRMWHETEEGEVIIGHPYLIPDKKYSKRKKQPLFPSSIINEEESFTSRSFYIKYCDQNFHLNDLCLFRFNFPAFPIKQRDLFLEIHLCGLETSEVRPSNRLTGGKAGKKKAKNLDKDNFSSLSQSVLVVQNAGNGIHQYFPVLFESYFFSTADCMIHSCPLSFNFKKRIDKLYDADEEGLTVRERYLRKLMACETQEEFIVTATFGGGPKKIQNFVKIYSKFLSESLRDLIMFIERMLALFESEIEEAKTSDVDGIKMIKNSIKEDYYDFPSYISNVEIDEEKLNDAQKTEKAIFETLFEACPNISENLKSGLLKSLFMSVEDIMKEGDNNQLNFAALIIDDMRRKSGMLHNYFFKLIDILYITKTNYINSESGLYHRRVRERLKQSLFFHEFKSKDLGYSGEENIGEFHQNVANSQRENQYYRNLSRAESIGVEDLRLFPKADDHPIVFKEKYKLDGLEPIEDILPDEEKPHLVIFVHGYQGCSFDMKPLKNCFSYFLPGNVFLHCAVSNDIDTKDEIDGLGTKLASEVKDLIQQNFKKGQLYKLSFIGHSLGGLIIRASLPRLLEFKDIFYTFITFGTPHLGCRNNQSMLVKTGLKLISKFMGHKSLNQMNLSDEAKIKECYLYKLSLYEGLEHFRHFILFASYQDYYAPFHSARIEYGDAEKKDKRRGYLIKKMAQNILKRLKVINFIRVDMNFKSSKSLDSFIGREAHIRILENGTLHLMLAHFFKKYLE